MIELTASPTELTTAATDFLLAVGCAFAAWRVGLGQASFRHANWRAVFTLLAGASLLGAVVHGLGLPSWLATALWHPLYVALGLAVALLLVGALYDARGESSARGWRRPLLGLGVAAYALTVVLDGAFLVFVLYEGVATLTALALYSRLALVGTLPGAWRIVAGLALNLVAAAVQASDLELEMIFHFDHNGLFHIVLMPAFALLYSGIAAGPRETARTAAESSAGIR